jgi:alanine racemase
LLAASRLFPHLPLSLSNSAGVFLGEGFHVQEVRPGSAIYGLCAPHVQPCPLKPVVALYAPVLQWRQIDSAGTVGYGATHALAAGSRIAVLPVGYADGYPRALGNRAHVAVHCRDGVVREASVVGRVSMDLICVDVSAIAHEQLGDETVMELIGPNMPLNRLAAEAETLNLELLTRLSGRYARVILPVTKKAMHVARA